MEPVGILIVVLLVLNLAAIVLTGQFLEREVRRHAVRNYESLNIQITGIRKVLEALEKGRALAMAVDARAFDKFRSELWTKLDELKRGETEEDVEKFEAFRAELWKRLDRLESGAADGTAEFEEGVRNLLAYTAGKVPGVEVHL